MSVATSFAFHELAVVVVGFPNNVFAMRGNASHSGLDCDTFQAKHLRVGKEWGLGDKSYRTRGLLIQETSSVVFELALTDAIQSLLQGARIMVW